MTAVRVYTNTVANLGLMGISADGNRLAFSDGSQLYLADRSANTVLSLGVTPGLGQPPPKFSANSRLLVFSQSTAGANQVYLYDCLAGTSELVSHRFDSALVPANGLSDSPDLSPDGRFVAYCSSAVDVVGGNPNSIRNIVMYDTQTGSNTLVSVGVGGRSSGNNASLRPMFSADGQTILFESWTEDLAQRDFNQSSDLFAYTLLLAKLTPQPGPGFRVSWKAVPGKSYRLQFKNNLDEPSWQNAVGSITTMGVNASFQDSSPSGLQRFYRVVSP
jgi:Tol biopolymer transport system component